MAQALAERPWLEAGEDADAVQRKKRLRQDGEASVWVETRLPARTQVEAMMAHPPFTGHTADMPKGSRKRDQEFADQLKQFMRHQSGCEVCKKNPLEPCSEGAKILEKKE